MGAWYLDTLLLNTYFAEYVLQEQKELFRSARTFLLVGVYLLFCHCFA